MPGIVRSSRAEQDLVDIWFQIAKHDERAADRILELIQRRCEVLLKFHYGGEACPAFGHDMRWFPAGNYVIFYRPAEDGIQVVRVLDGRRDLDAAFYE
jgi:toxin ParE1/3/4